MQNPAHGHQPQNDTCFAATAAPGATTGRDLRPHTSLIGIAMVLRMPKFPRAARLWPVLALALYGVVQTALAPLRQEPARYAAMKKPDYPPEALLAGTEGKTVLRVLISASGAASRVEVHQSSGHPSLDAAALQSVRQFQFIPARTNGVAHASWARIPIGFSIESPLHTRLLTRPLRFTDGGDR